MTSVDMISLSLSLSRPDFKLNVDLRLPAQGITVLFGPSGSGKTTILRCVAGLEKSAGRVAIGHEVWQDNAQGIFKPTWQRDLGYVFQEASLFEHLNVEENLKYGIKRVDKPARHQALQSAIELLGIEHLLMRASSDLSGGERQRVAIARALALQPRLLLLDEPLASLDTARRQEILPWLERMHRELKIPVLYVTHSTDEMARLADHLVVLDKGSVASSGSPADVLSTARVALAEGDNAGSMTVGTVVARDTHFHLAEVTFEGASLWVQDQGVPIGQTTRMRILARDVTLSTPDQNKMPTSNYIDGVIEAIDTDLHPSLALVGVRCGSTLVLSRTTRRSLRDLGLGSGAHVRCHIRSASLMS